MRIRALTWRIIMQLFHDKRTVFFVLFAPALILTLVYFILDSGDTLYTIGTVSITEELRENLENLEDVELITLDSSEQTSAIKSGKVMASLVMGEDKQTVSLFLDGSNTAYAKKIQAIVQSALTQDRVGKMKQELQTAAEALKNSGMGTMDGNLEIPELETDYVYGQADTSMFDEFGASLIGIIVFFLTFLLAGIHFLTERSSGTLEKLLSTPIRHHEILIGYVAGFSIPALFQTIVVTFYTVYVLGMHVAGNIIWVFLMNLLTAIVALTLGILLSTVANSEFQMVQFIPIVIIPQIFLCGLFHLAEGWENISHLIPLYYTSHALKEVMLKGNGWNMIRNDAMILILFALLHMALNTLFLKKQSR